MRLIDADKIDAREVIVGSSEFAQDIRDAVYRMIDRQTTIEATPVVYGEWIDNTCSNCGKEALFTICDEAIYDYDWEENLCFSHIETDTEYHLTNFCPNCGAKMDGKAV